MERGTNFVTITKFCDFLGSSESCGEVVASLFLSSVRNPAIYSGPLEVAVASFCTAPILVPAILFPAQVVFQTHGIADNEG